MQTFAHTENGTRRVWNVERLWTLASPLPVQDMPLDSISALDEVTWFALEPEQLPTCRRVADHARRIQQADFTNRHMAAWGLTRAAAQQRIATNDGLDAAIVAATRHRAHWLVTSATAKAADSPLPEE